MSRHYLDDLTQAQREAVQHHRGPAVVLAAPGSGKTRVITYRIVHLLHEHNTNPAAIVAITFTNKAAKEMKERVQKLLPSATANRLQVSTFHSFCARLLRKEHQAANLKRNFTICDDSDSLSYVIQAVALEADEDPKKVKGWKDKRAPDKIAKFISKCKQSVLTADEILEQLTPVSSRDDIFYANVYSRYEKTLQRSCCVDFDDLIMMTVRLLRSNDEIRTQYATAIEQLLVDECQDTNPSQYELVTLLSCVHHNLFVVGDDDQSIYRFRGAEPENLNKLQQDFENVRVLYLEDNFRSTVQIAAVANALISHNKSRSDKQIKARIENGEPVRCIELLDPKQEAAVIVDEMLTDVRRGKAQWKDYAILYRMHSRSRVFEELMVTNNVPHRIIGGLGFYNRAVVKDLLAYMKLLVNGADDASFIRIYNSPPRGFGDTSYAKVYKQKEELNVPIIDFFKKRLYKQVLGRTLAGAEQLRETFKALYTAPKDKVAPLIELAAEASGYNKMLKADGGKEAYDKLDHIDELVKAAAEFDQTHGSGLLRFLEWAALMQNADQDTDDDRVHLMTCHAAKGLEFKKLYVIGAIDGVIPIVKDTDDYGRLKTVEEMEQDLEEERRIFFVALTRAKRELTITHVQQQFRYNATVECIPSRFLRELEDTVEHSVLAGTNAGSHLMATVKKPKTYWQKNNGKTKR